MIQGIVATPGCVAFDRRRLPRQIVSQIAMGALAAGLGALAMHAPLVARRTVAKLQVVESPEFIHTRAIAANPFGALYQPRISTDTASSRLAQSASLEASLGQAPRSAVIAAPESHPAAQAAPRLGESAPLPPPRPSELAPPANPPVPVRRPETQIARTTGPGAPADNRSFIQKLLGIGQSSGPALAYAAPEGRAGEPRVNLSGAGSSGFSLFGSSSSNPSGRYDRWTAVYDLTAHTVYLPNGTRLEAHSGLGNRLDDPRYVSERDRGATPPHLYDLEPREQVFHGVQALRLIPVGGGGDIFGRAGLLAHSYMLGPNGDSNGCVSFKNYDAFLQAYQSGQIKHLAVVARLD